MFYFFFRSSDSCIMSDINNFTLVTCDKSAFIVPSWSIARASTVLNDNTVVNRIYRLSL